MYRFLRPLLFRLDPETAHQLTLYLAPPKPVSAFGLMFKNPIGLAAGYDKDAVAIRGLSTFGFGHLEVGTVTPKPQPGNPRPRIFRLPEDQTVINRMGFPGKGAAFMLKSLKGKQRDSLFGSSPVRMLLDATSRKPQKVQASNRNQMMLGINLGKNKKTPNEEA